MTDPDAIDQALRDTRLPRQYHPIIRAAGARTGIGAAGSRGERARVYVVLLMAYYLGQARTTPIAPRELSAGNLEKWAKRRAWDELERDVDRLPALRLELEPAA